MKQRRLQALRDTPRPSAAGRLAAGDSESWSRVNRKCADTAKLAVSMDAPASANRMKPAHAASGKLVSNLAVQEHDDHQQ